MSPSPKVSRRVDNTGVAIAVILATGFFLALGDAVIKGISTHFTLWQIFTLRSLLVLPVLAVALRWRTKALALWPKRPGWTLLRSVLLSAMWIAYYTSLLYVELSIASAVYYSSPIFITLFAAILLGDSVGRAGWFAVVLGAVGVLLILQPTASALNLYSLLPLASALAYALAMILTRSQCADEEPLLLSIWLNLVMLLLGIGFSLVLSQFSSASLSAGEAFLFGAWGAMNLLQWAAMVVLAVAIIVGSVGAAVAYQLGRPTTVATFDFAYVAFATAWGALLFHEVPGPIASLGVVLIAAAGLLAVRSRGAE
ncbi:DMT family transporter [Saccharospirillum sp. HFRX-1]|uniref:DMT family transporter n=1 Tax=unclassified Saccharospirillum TaxID=2633430 RepID=UPI003722CA94